MRQALLVILLLASTRLRAGVWGFEAGAGEIQNLLGPNPLSETAVPLSDYILSHQKTDGPAWSLEYEAFGEWGAADSHLMRLERRNWFRSPEGIGQRLNWNLGWSLGWRWSEGPGLWASGPELGLMAEGRIWRGLWFQLEGQQSSSSQSFSSEANAGFALRGLGLQGLELRASMPLFASWSYPNFETESTDLGLFKASLKYRFGGPLD